MEWREYIKQDIGITQVASDLGLTYRAIWRWTEREAFPKKAKYKTIMAIAKERLPLRDYHQFCASFTREALGE